MGKKHKKVDGQKLKVVATKELVTGEAVLDGNCYSGCVFKDSVLVWSGGQFLIEECEFVGTRGFRFPQANAIANQTVRLLLILGMLNENTARQLNGPGTADANRTEEATPAHTEHSGAESHPVLPAPADLPSPAEPQAGPLARPDAAEDASGYPGVPRVA